ncbi:uncharacterized protein LOC110876793 [Helianthus annuus]|uniref:uncharacterized protein LOC110876793 n=1 Tax=Helianthus annuus TaxID=4232 RepID=UPI000B8F5C2A|nr:uncharacterized protein LOC110876793 [Helianthus annuus]
MTIREMSAEEKKKYRDEKLMKNTESLGKPKRRNGEKLKKRRKKKKEKKLRLKPRKRKITEVFQVRRTVKEVPEFEIKADVEEIKVPEKCMNFDSLIKQNNELLHNIKRLKESYDTLNREMNKYTESNSEQAVAMNTLKGAYMRQLDDVNFYTEKCAELELKIYLIVEKLKTFDEEKTSEEKKSETEEEDEVEISGISAEKEQKSSFWRETNKEFLAKKQDDMKKSAAQKKTETRTCFQCKTIERGSLKDKVPDSDSTFEGEEFVGDRDCVWMLTMENSSKRSTKTDKD